MATHIVFDELGMTTKGFRPDKEVEKLLLKLELIDKRIERTLFRQNILNGFATLKPLEQQLLIRRFKYKEEVNCPQSLVESVLDEIEEIETAICFMENIELEEENELSDDVEENLERMCDFFAL